MSSLCTVKPRPPILSLLSLVSAAVFFFGSIPILHLHLMNQSNNAEYMSEGARESTGQMAGFALMAGACMAGVGGALVGVILGVIAQFRRERWLVFRILTFTGNLALLFYGSHLLYPTIHL